MFYLCKISSRPIKGTKDKIFSKENNNHLNPRYETKRQRASPNTNYIWRWKTKSFGWKQIPCRWEKLGSSKNDLCPLGGISFVWLNVMAAKTSFWLNTLAWARVHPQCITVSDIWIGPGFEWRNCDKRCHDDDATVPRFRWYPVIRIQRTDTRSKKCLMSLLNPHQSAVDIKRWKSPIKSEVKSHRT